MSLKKEKLRIVIGDFEKGKITAEKAIDLIYDISSLRIDELRLKNYWRSESIEELINSLSYEVYKDWADIDDSIAMQLLKEIKGNIGDDSILARNSEALEKRYRKASGTVRELIFHNDYENKEILSRLKIDTVTTL